MQKFRLGKQAGTTKYDSTFCILKQLPCKVLSDEKHCAYRVSGIDKIPISGGQLLINTINLIDKEAQLGLGDDILCKLSTTETCVHWEETDILSLEASCIYVLNLTGK